MITKWNPGWGMARVLPVLAAGLLWTACLQETAVNPQKSEDKNQMAVSALSAPRQVIQPVQWLVQSINDHVELEGDWVHWGYRNASDVNRAKRPGGISSWISDLKIVDGIVSHNKPSASVREFGWGAGKPILSANTKNGVRIVSSPGKTGYFEFRVLGNTEPYELTVYFSVFKAVMELEAKFDFGSPEIYRHTVTPRLPEILVHKFVARIKSVGRIPTTIRLKMLANEGGGSISIHAVTFNPYTNLSGPKPEMQLSNNAFESTLGIGEPLEISSLTRAQDPDGDYLLGYEYWVQDPFGVHTKVGESTNLRPITHTVNTPGDYLYYAKAFDLFGRTDYTSGGTAPRMRVSYLYRSTPKKNISFSGIFGTYIPLEMENVQGSNVNGLVKSIALRLSLSHDKMKELRIALVGPNGRVAWVWRENPTTSGTFNVVFHDGGKKISPGENFGAVAPSGPFSNILMEPCPILGPWKLWIENRTPNSSEVTIHYVGLLIRPVSVSR